MNVANSKQKKILVSIIIPVFNQGEYLAECLSSIKNKRYQDYEVIIVNDGSTSTETINILKRLQKGNGGYKVINTYNYGLPTARNNGIKVAKGKYILPVDADDKIDPAFMLKAVEIFEKDNSVGIINSRIQFFGEKTGEKFLPEFSLKEILKNNIITATAFFRREDWEKVGGYKTYMNDGLEDWDFWLSIIELGKNVVLIPEILFHYRIKKLSMNSKIHSDPKTLFDLKLEVIKHHKKLYIEHFDVLEEIVADLNHHIYLREEALESIRNSKTYKVAQKLAKVSKLFKV